MAEQANQAEEPIGLRCPACDQPPRFLIGGNQAFCGNDDCKMLMWDPARTLAELAADLTVVDLRRQD